MVLALGTTCFMSGTLAKYVTSGQGSDSARVAKFGVAVTANGETFAKEYAKTDTSFTLAANTVVSADDVIAPGTAGDMASMTLTGTPEVAVRVSYDVTEFELTNWTTNGTDQYCPIIINVNGTKYNCLDATDIDNFEKTVKNAINAYSKDYLAGTDLSAEEVKGESLAISWEWPFESENNINDEKDTALGDRAAAGNAATIKLTVKTTVTQID